MEEMIEQCTAMMEGMGQMMGGGMMGGMMAIAEPGRCLPGFGWGGS